MGDYICRGCVGRLGVGGDDVKIIQQSGYRMTWNDDGSYTVGRLDDTEMPLITFDANLAIAYFISLTNKKAAPVSAGSGK